MLSLGVIIVILAAACSSGGSGEGTLVRSLTSEVENFNPDSVGPLSPDASAAATKRSHQDVFGGVFSVEGSVFEVLLYRYKSVADAERSYLSESPLDVLSCDGSMCEAAQRGEVLREELVIDVDALAISREVAYCFGPVNEEGRCVSPLYWAWVRECTLQVSVAGGAAGGLARSTSSLSATEFEGAIRSIAIGGLSDLLGRECSYRE